MQIFSISRAALCTTPMLNAKLNGSSNAIRVKTTEASGTTTSSGVRIVPNSKKHLKVTQCAVLFIILVLIALLCSVFIRPQIFLSDCKYAYHCYISYIHILRRSWQPVNLSGRCWVGRLVLVKPWFGRFWQRNRGRPTSILPLNLVSFGCLWGKIVGNFQKLHHHLILR